jgi:hypothetical protein
VKGLKDRAPAVRVKAAEEAGALGEEAAALAPYLCEAALDPSPKVAKPMLWALGRVRPDLHPAVSVLVLDTDPRRHLAALQALGSLGEAGVPAAPVLLSYLKRTASARLPDPGRQGLLRAGLEAVGNVAPKDPEALKLLLSIGRGRDRTLRGQAVEMLGTMAAGNEAIRKQVLPVVAAVVRDPQLRLVGVEAAGNLGPDARSLLPELREYARSRNESLRTLAQEAVASIEAKGVPAGAAQVRAALRWLVRNQQPDGSWKTGMGANDPAILVTTSFCALALMASGDRYRAEVDRAANYVAQGIFQNRSPVPSLDQGNWKIGIGGLFLCEYYARFDGKDPRRNAQLRKVLEQVVEEALQRVERSGGWGHTPRLKNPLGYVELEVMSTWMLATLGAAQRLGVKVPADKLKQPLQFVEDSCNEGQGGVGYSPRAGQKGFGCPCRTGGAIFAFAVLGQQKHPLYPRMLAYWKEEVGGSDGGHGSVAMGLLGSALGARQAGGEDWKAFEDTFFPKILANAFPDGSFKHLVGTKPQSVSNADPQVGRAYNTAVFALVLQLGRGNLKFLGRKYD